MAGRKGARIVETARKLFLERGYDATSLDNVAAVSGVSKTTVYNNFEHKQALFEAVVLGVTERAEGILADLAVELERPGTVVDRLTKVATRLARGVLNPAVIQMRRLAIAEALRFPALVNAYWDRAPEGTIALLTEAFDRLMDADELKRADARTAALQFAYSVIGPFQDTALLRPDTSVSEGELDAHVAQVVATFLEGYAAPSTAA